MGYGAYIEVADFSSGKDVMEAARRRAQDRRAVEQQAAREKRIAAQREQRRRLLAEKAARQAQDAKREREFRILERQQQEAQARFEAAKLARSKLEYWKAKEREERAKLLVELGIRYVPPMAVIIRRICRALDITPSDVMSSRRTRDVAFARQAIMYWCVRLTGMSYPQIASRLGGRDHTTCLWGATIYPDKRAKQGRYLRPTTRSGKNIARRAA